MGTNIYKLYLEIIINLVKNTPNDQELGEKLRILYNTQLKNLPEHDTDQTRPV